MKIEFNWGKKDKKDTKKIESVIYDTVDEELAKEIAQEILKQKDRLAIINCIFANLPSELVDWFKGSIRASTKGHVSADIETSVVSKLFLPGDLVIRRNRDPKVGDIVEVGQRFMEGQREYQIGYFKIISTDFKQGTLNVVSLTNPQNKGIIYTANVICVIDKVIEFNTPKWKKLIQLYDIEYNFIDIQAYVKSVIQEIEKIENFYNKEEILKTLNERLSLIKDLE